MLSPIISARFLVFSAGAEADDFFGEPVAACGFLGGSILVVLAICCGGAEIDWRGGTGIDWWAGAGIDWWAGAGNDWWGDGFLTL